MTKFLLWSFFLAFVAGGCKDASDEICQKAARHAAGCLELGARVPALDRCDASLATRMLGESCSQLLAPDPGHCRVALKHRHMGKGADLLICVPEKASVIAMHPHTEGPVAKVAASD